MGRDIERPKEARQQGSNAALGWQVEPGGPWVAFCCAEEHVGSLVPPVQALSLESEGQCFGVDCTFGSVKESQPIIAGSITALWSVGKGRKIKSYTTEMYIQRIIEFRSVPKTRSYFVIDC